MNKILIALFAGALGVGACASNNSPKTDTNIDTLNNAVTTNPADTSVSGCYSLIANGDTASLQLQRQGPTFRGSLSYNLSGKDRNDGTFEGGLNGNILSGWYFFRSEGVMSVREVYWKWEGGNLLPANGEVGVRNDTAYFKNPAQLVYDGSRVFTKVKCII